MAVVYGLNEVPAEVQRGGVAVGVFDGVHWGHQAIFHELVGVAERWGGSSVALTFDRHPAELLAPASAPDYITSLDQRIELIEAAGVQDVVVAEFDAWLSNLTAQEFVSLVLRDILQTRHVVVGSNFVFGKGRSGDIRLLKGEAARLGMGVSVVPSVIVDGGPVSSTRVRALIAEGDMSGAARLLGRKFTLRGRVVSGSRVGRKIGFPTANLETAPRQVLPARGVYAVEAGVDRSVYAGLCNIGSRPTFGGGKWTVEVHLMGFEGSLYGRTLDVAFVRRLRDEMKFESPEQLAEQIKADLERAR